MTYESIIQYLLDQVGKGQATPEECRQLRELIDADATGEIAVRANIFFSGEEEVTTKQGELSVYWQHALETIFEVEKKVGREDVAERGGRIRMIRMAWFRYAAAIILIAGIVGGILSRGYKTRTSDQAGNQRLREDVLPGGQKALLTLADGRRITLDSTGNGIVAEQGNSSVVKLANGEIRYDVKGMAQGKSAMNTLSTPRGGQYQLTLPDGTRVWLNAASAITYPVAFVEGQRRVLITGEAYFEVAGDKDKPFIVDIDGKSSIEVLGTKFNVNSYTGEGNIRTTLLEGAVKVRAGLTGEALLKPGQQAVATNGQGNGSVRVVPNVDVDQVVAWKNGLFNFNGADVKDVMRQLERWYDIEVQYEGKAPDVVLDGEMYRNVPLSDVISFFRKMNVNMRLDRKKLFVSANQ